MAKAQEAENAFGRDLAPTGATLEPEYYQGKQGVAGVPVMDLKDASFSIGEEALQFGVGTSLGSGAFFLGVERLFTEGVTDPVLWICVAFIISGAVLGVTGYRQATRRVKRLMRYCPPEEAQP